MATGITQLDLKIRYHIYHHFAEHCRPPTYQEIATLLNLPAQTARQSFHKLHQHHFILLEPGTDTIRMAIPFSAVPTNYKVSAGNKSWWANCAWDTLGIAAALNSDVQIECVLPDSRETAEFQVKNGAFDGKNHLVHFLLPFKEWYSDLIYT